MKQYALYVSANGDAFERKVVAYVQFDAEALGQLRQLREVLKAVDDAVHTLQRSVAHIALWTMDVMWLLFGDANDNWEHFEALDSYGVEQALEDANGVLPISTEIYNRHIERFKAAHNQPDGEGSEFMLRTELDHMLVSAEGITFTCAEKHAAAEYTTNRIDWTTLFEERVVHAIPEENPSP